MKFVARHATDANRHDVPVRMYVHVRVKAERDGGRVGREAEAGSHQRENGIASERRLDIPLHRCDCERYVANYNSELTARWSTI